MRDREEVDPCIVEPADRYRGAENQLYRVEIHDGGSLATGQTPTFKWSRENGAAVFPIKAIKSNGADFVILELENMGRDERFGLAVNDWVEIENDAYVLKNMASPLLKVKKVDRYEMTVTLEKKSGLSYNLVLGSNTLLRRWDQKKGVTVSGVLNIEESNASDDWVLMLEDGIKIQFKESGTYRTGDYWLIPARAVLSDVQWPKDDDLEPKFLPPHGVMHHFAPLAIISVENSSVSIEHDCRCSFKPLSSECRYSYYGQLGTGIGVDLLSPE
jgi:hypothetical protein